MARTGKTKNQNQTIKMLPGHVARVRVRCGKSNCRCAHGQRHLAHYHVMLEDGKRTRRYIRRADVEMTRAACNAYRQLQAQLRAGRAQYRALMAYARRILQP